MKYLLALALLLRGCVHTVHAHYSVSKLVVNGTVSKDWQYIRKTSTSNYPYYDIDSPGLRCGEGATTTGPGTKTAAVPAGDTVGFMTLNTQDGFWHPGDALGYMSRAPGDKVESYQGDGDWFKIKEYGFLNATQWNCEYPTCHMLNYTIPKTTPPGKYLLRAEQLYILDHGLDYLNKSMVQLYIGCAHIQVIGRGGGTPGPLVKLPGAYSINQRQFNPPTNWTDITRIINGTQFDISDYTSPGPALWSG